MLTMCLVISAIAAIVFGTLVKRTHSEGCEWGVAIFGVLAVALLIACLVIWPTIATGERRIDQKIEMYTEENARIEAEVSIIVKQYMEFEKATFDEIAPDAGADVMMLVSLFPELQSDTLVQQQIELYTSNAKRIQELKAAKIDLSLSKWLLYFGS